MDLMDAPVEDGAMPSPADMGVGLDQEKMAAFDAAVNKRRDDEAALVTKNQAEAKSALAQLETERQTQFQGRMQANREKEQVKMEQMAADNESPRTTRARTPGSASCRSWICKRTPSPRRGTRRACARSSSR